MPKRTIVVWSCSLCSKETHTQSDLTHFKLTGGGTSLVYDVCADCQRKNPIFSKFLNFGMREQPTRKGSTAKAGKGAAAVQGVVCPDCAKIFTQHGISLHRMRAHGVRTEKAAKVADRGHGPYKCDARGCDYGAKGPQGLASHKRIKHPAKRARRADLRIAH